MPSRTPSFALLATFALAAAASGADCPGESYGAGVTLAEPTAIAAILDAPEAWAGKQVRVEGKVQEVCAMAGCWMTLVAADAADGRPIKVQVEDGEMVFPLSARGHEAVAEGKVEKIEMSRDRYVRFQKHLAKELGREFDEKSVVGEGPFSVVQVQGTGARVCSASNPS